MGEETVVDGMTIAMPVIQVLGLLLAFLAGAALARVLGAFKVPLSAADPAAGLRIPSPIPPAGDRGRLVFGHEMKNYLCVLKGNARLLRLEVRSEEQAAIIDRIDRVVERLETFAWKEPEASPDLVRTGRRECVDLLETARSCSRIHSSPAGAEFSVTGTGGPPYVQGDPQRLEQVLMNLYGNALEAGARRITTRVRGIGAEVEVAVEDDGRGCAPDQADRIFQSFPPSPAPVKAETPGGARRGLGLSIVRSIVETHGGRIRASVKNGRGDGETGLVVYLHFPVYAPLSSPAPGLRPPIARRDPHPAEISLGSPD